MPLPICVIGDSYAMAGPKWPVFCIGELYILDRKTDAKILSVHLVNDFWMQATYLRNDHGNCGPPGLIRHPKCTVHILENEHLTISHV